MRGGWPSKFSWRLWKCVDFESVCVALHRTIPLSHLDYVTISRAADLAYKNDFELTRRELLSTGLGNLKLFCVESTFGYLAWNDAFAVLAFRGTESGDLTDIKSDLNALLANDVIEGVG